MYFSIGLPLSELPFPSDIDELFPGSPVLSWGLFIWMCKGCILLWISRVWLTNIGCWAEWLLVNEPGASYLLRLGSWISLWWPSGKWSSDLLSKGLPLTCSSLLPLCCLFSCSAWSASGLRRFLVRLLMICSPLFCLMMFKGLGVCKEHTHNEQKEKRKTH